MRVRQVVLDTNVVVAGLRSRHGASHRVLQLIGETSRFQINLSVPLVLEYEEVLTRQSRALGLTRADIRAFLDYVCAVGCRREIFLLWRPCLSDPDDDLVLELAVESDSEFVITFNVRDFRGLDRFGIAPVTPRDFLKIIGDVK
ncbi:MAG: putative toxin-antitoxin system toxin component, PIN family [Planctomycetota bacterium]|nr:MAG: putative toxin-antitoxin system toxin component, PIN family [Planctomycetota bacterium]REJ93138.1 MAG: putative toxin-antitoxin system toxin component, PIN family [Planctomycetota bacterium]REK21830.1 MAG: putative toxin-antitoxin system toxin component, PIN family [Planctomycetota bacterium]REK37630.1 MAG: putative toxin-antitoxin system toxin component, PIN family [Planctomycetota bacterium]